MPIRLGKRSAGVVPQVRGGAGAGPTRVVWQRSRHRALRIVGVCRLCYWGANEATNAVATLGRAVTAKSQYQSVP